MESPVRETPLTEDSIPPFKINGVRRILKANAGS